MTASNTDSWQDDDPAEREREEIALRKLSRFTPKEILTLRDRLPGWEQLWGRFYGVLSWTLNTKCREMEMAGKVSWKRYDANGALMDAFIAHMLEIIERRWENGTLFMNVDPWKPETVVAYVLVYNKLVDKARAFIRERKSFSVPNAGSDEPRIRPEELVDASTVDGKEARAAVLESAAEGEETGAAAAAELQRAWREVSERFTDIVISYRSINREERMAGIQLFPRADWQPESMRPLLKHIHQHLAENGKAVDPDLLAAHERRKCELGAKIDREIEALSKKQFAPAFIREKRRSIQDSLREFLSMPLDADTLVWLLAFSKANAEKQRSEYMKKRKKLLEDACDRFLSGDKVF